MAVTSQFVIDQLCHNYVVLMRPGLRNDLMRQGGTPIAVVETGPGEYRATCGASGATIVFEMNPTTSILAAGRELQHIARRLWDASCGKK